MIKVKVKLFLHVMKAYGTMHIQHQSIFTSALHEDGWLGLHIDQVILWKRAPVIHRTRDKGGPQSQSGHFVTAKSLSKL